MNRLTQKKPDIPVEALPAQATRLHLSMANNNFWLENRMLGFLGPNVGLPCPTLP